MSSSAELYMMECELRLYESLPKLHSSYADVSEYLSFKDPDPRAQKYRQALYGKLVADAKLYLATAKLLAALCSAHGNDITTSES